MNFDCAYGTDCHCALQVMLPPRRHDLFKALAVVIVDHRGTLGWRLERMHFVKVPGPANTYAIASDTLKHSALIRSQLASLLTEVNGRDCSAKAMEGELNAQHNAWADTIAALRKQWRQKRGGTKR